MAWTPRGTLPEAFVGKAAVCFELIQSEGPRRTAQWTPFLSMALTTKGFRLGAFGGEAMVRLEMDGKGAL